MRRVGHKGADLILPGNTRASFDAALQAGVDMIEFDVLRVGGRLVLAHDQADAQRVDVESLSDGLEHLSAQPYATVELDVDLKAPGYELEVLAALREAGLLDRALISSQHPASLRVLRAAAPQVRLGLSVPRLRRDPFRHRLTLLPALSGLLVYRAALPVWSSRALRGGLCDAVMAHFRLVTPRLVRAVHQAGGELYAWTVDDPGQITRLERLGVDGLITNDPRLFAWQS
jgi:glycerophosphoryl diester phosphodiesterase